MCVRLPEDLYSPAEHTPSVSLSSPLTRCQQMKSAVFYFHFGTSKADVSYKNNLYSALNSVYSSPFTSIAL